MEGCRNLHINLAEGEKIVYHFLLAKDLTLSCLLCGALWGGPAWGAASPPPRPWSLAAPTHAQLRWAPQSRDPQLPSWLTPTYSFQELEKCGPFSHCLSPSMSLLTLQPRLSRALAVVGTRSCPHHHKRAAEETVQKALQCQKEDELPWEWSKQASWSRWYLP